MGHLTLDQIATVQHSKVYATLKRFQRLQSTWASNGAADSEPNSLLAGGFIKTVNGDRAIIDQWQLYRGMKGTATANRNLSIMFDDLVREILKDRPTARLTAIYMWGPYGIK